MDRLVIISVKLNENQADRLINKINNCTITFDWEGLNRQKDHKTLTVNEKTKPFLKHVLTEGLDKNFNDELGDDINIMPTRNITKMTLNRPKVTKVVKKPKRVRTKYNLDNLLDTEDLFPGFTGEILPFEDEMRKVNRKAKKRKNRRS